MMPPISINPFGMQHLSATQQNIVTPKETKIAENIVVQLKANTPTDFLDKVKEALKTISEGEVGQRLLKKIGDGKHVVLIKYVSGENSTNSHTNCRIREIGCPSTIQLNGSENSLIGFKAEKIENPFFMILVHELIHAYHNSYGKSRDQSQCGDIWTNREEYKTIIGHPSKKSHRTKSKISENAIRAEHQLPLRYSHLGFEGTSTDKLKEVKLEATAHQVTSIFQQVVVGQSSYQVPAPVKVHQVSLKAFKNMQKDLQ